MTRKSPSHIQYEFTARRIFTDREDPQAAFGDALHTPQPNDGHHILNFMVSVDKVKPRSANNSLKP